MQEILIQLCSPFLGSLGFALLFNTRGRHLLPAALGGLLSWGVYLWGMSLELGEVGAYVAASVVLTLYSEWMAHRMKCPATVYLVSAAIPLVPGKMLYTTMGWGIRQDWNQFMSGVTQTLMLALAIAGGILVAMTLLSVSRQLKAHFREGNRTENH